MASRSSASGNEGVTNFLKLQNLFGASTSQIYRSHFVTLWNHYFGATSGEWQNTKDFVDKKFISGGIGKEIYESCDENEKRILRAGNISLWDLSLLLDVIKKLQKSIKIKISTSDGGIKFLSEEKLNETKILWEEVDYQSRIIVDYKNYGNWMTKIVNALEENGMSKEKIFTTAFFLEKPAEDIPELDDVGKLAERLKQNGNLAFGKKEFEKAWKFYTEAIELDGLPDELLGTLYSNRTLCNVHMNKLEDAEFDAKCTMTLRPSWFKGYLRRGRVYEMNEEFDKAEEFILLAEALAESGNKEVASAKEACKTKRNSPYFNCPILLNTQNMAKQSIYRNPCRDEILEKNKVLLQQEDPLTLTTHGDLYERGGLGYPQDYKRAAELYSKAALKGHPLGMLGLARLTEEGKGVPKDVGKALEMCKQVAAMAPFCDDPIETSIRAGAVYMAQMKLGDIYIKGKIVPKNLEVAISWFKKGLENGCYLSPQQLGFIYLSEEKRNAPIAVLHFMVASYRGNVQAMEQLANMFLNDMENPNWAQRWWKLAVHCGSIEMKKQEQRFMKEELTPDFNPFRFRVEIKLFLESRVEFRDLMKKFDEPKFSALCTMWDAAFEKFDRIPDEAQRELCRAMKPK